MIGVLALDRFIVVAIDNPRRHLDVAQLLVGKMWLARPHLLDIRFEDVELRRRWRKSQVLLRGALLKGFEDGALVDVLHTRGIGIRGKREQSRQPVGMVDGDIEANDRSVTPSD